MQVRNKLAEIRQLRGISAAELASRIGVTRQTIYAIEAHKYVPNTLVALRLSEILEVPVEQVFAIEGESGQAGKQLTVDLIEDPSTPYVQNQPLKICQVGNRKIGVPTSPIHGEIPPADAVIVDSARPESAVVQIFGEEAYSENRLLLAGCDPAIPALARYLLKHGNIEVIHLGCSSTRAMKLLQERKIHIGGTHLSGKQNKENNLQVIHRFFPKGGCRVATFASWEEGFVTARGNPKGISGVGDLGRKNVTLINREQGAGSRILLDSLLRKTGVIPKDVKGYRQVAKGHILAAWHVHDGLADCCIATEASARVFGLHFIPLVSERFDLVIPDRYWDMPSVQTLMDALNRASLRKELETLGGYDTSKTGSLVQ
ncbi:MAG: helix-turn-helix domain-containing protein [Acidobacteria bacterium]|nr:helix-turn-helix domain-containing protein [Acidobacteriota bacterium]